MSAAARGRENFGECSPQLTAHRLAIEYRESLYAGISIESPARPKYTVRGLSSTRLERINESDTNTDNNNNESDKNKSNSNRIYRLMDPSKNNHTVSSNPNSNPKKRRTAPTVCLLHGLQDTVVPPSATEYFTVAVSSLFGAENVHTVYTKVRRT
jgi:hypothetical protein